MHLTAEPQGFTAMRYRITSDGPPIVEIVLPPCGPSTMAPLAGVTYRMRCEGAGRVVFTMAAESAATPVASAYRLMHGERVVGFMRPGGVLRRGGMAELPDDLSLEASVFLVWIVLLLWRRRRMI